MSLPAYLAPLGEPEAFYRVINGQVCRWASGLPVPVACVEASIAAAVDMALDCPCEDRAELWIAQLSDLVRAARKAKVAAEITQPMGRAA